MEVIRAVSRAGGYVAMTVVLLMMLLIFADVFLRYLFNSPIEGVTELTELMMTWLLLAIAWGAFEGTHVKIDLVMNRFPQGVQRVVEIITLVLSLGIYVITVWQGVKAIQYSLGHGVKTTILAMPESLSMGFFTFSFVLFCLAIAALIVRRTAEVIKR